MCKVGRTKEYIQWLKNLKDLRARNRIGIRVRHFSLGNLGDVKSVGDGVLECRIHYGPGYRLYFTWREEILILLWGGTKTTQRWDIEKAKALSRNL